MYGISIYPNKEKYDDTISYIKLANQLGYKRIFSSLLYNDRPKDEELNQFKSILQYARKLGFEIILDVNPQTYKALNISETNLSFFKSLGATGIRLDSNFDGLVESIMTYDNSDLSIELNISNDTDMISNILSYQPNTHRIIGCHNFYPQRYTGLDLNYFLHCSAKYKKLGLRTAAFVSSQVAKNCPLIYNDGLPTLEQHRDLDLVTQAKHLIATGLIDDIIISNSFASEDELRQMASLNNHLITLDINFENSVSDIEREIVLKNLHFRRGDITSYSIRSTFVKLKYQNVVSIPPTNTPNILHRGDITIGNNNFGQYKAELKIVLQEMKNIDHLQNVVGHIPDNELFLIDYIKPWTKFIFKERV